MAQSLVDQYRAEFEELKRQVEAMRALLKESGLLGSEIDTSEIDGLRQKLLTGFDKKKIIKEHSGPDACRCCHYSSGPNYSPLRIYDIAYLLVKNSDWQLPEPDWEDLAKDNPRNLWIWNYTTHDNHSDMHKCLFLGPQGCLYGQNRPAVCLSFICNGAVRAVLNNVGELDFAQNHSHAHSPLGDAVRKAIGFPHYSYYSENFGIAVSDWYYKVLLPKTGKSEQEIISAFEKT